MIKLMFYSFEGKSNCQCLPSKSVSLTDPVMGSGPFLEDFCLKDKLVVEVRKLKSPTDPVMRSRPFSASPLSTWCDTQYISGGNSFTLPHFSNLATPPVSLDLSSWLMA